MGAVWERVTNKEVSATLEREMIARTAKNLLHRLLREQAVDPRVAIAQFLNLLVGGNSLPESKEFWKKTVKPKFTTMFFTHRHIIWSAGSKANLQLGCERK